MKRLALALMLSGWPALVPATAQTDWSGFREYQSEQRLLRFDAERGKAAGTLLVWPEVEQAHAWLETAEYWQQHGWDMVLLLPEQEQSRLDPAHEQPPQEQADWLSRQGQRLSSLLDNNADYPRLVLTQGSATLWYQQLVTSGSLPAPTGQIVMDAIPRQPARQRMLAISLARAPWPVLDLFSSENRATDSNRRQRRQSSARQASDYIAEQLHSPARPERQIAAWLVRRGWMPLPPGAPDYLRGRYTDETGISRPSDPGAERDTAAPGL